MKSPSEVRLRDGSLARAILQAELERTQPRRDAPRFGEPYTCKPLSWVDVLVWLPSLAVLPALLWLGGVL